MEAITEEELREAIDRGGGQTCDIEGVLREFRDRRWKVVEDCF